MNHAEPARKEARGIRKVSTHIEGLDEILNGGLPAGRTTLISGGPGTGKSLIGLEFLYRGALSGNPGMFLSFEETGESIRQNALTFGWDLSSLEQEGKFFLLEGQIDPHVRLCGDFNLKGLLAIIEGKAGQLGAENIVIDAIDVMMRIYNDSKQRQNEIFALNTCLKQRKMTAILTAKKMKCMDNDNHDYLDFMADCVIYLDQRAEKQVTTKRLQVVKYRGSNYGGNEYPFVIIDEGVHLYPISTVEMHYEPELGRISSGNASLDAILGGGYQRGACILISGATGTGKTAIASTFASSACGEGQKVLYVNFEESEDGMIAGMLSLGIELRPAIKGAALQIMSMMPESKGIEEHLFHIIRAIRRFNPQYLVIDAISANKRIAGEDAAFDFLIRVAGHCKKRGITVMLLNQSMSFSEHHEISGIGLSSVIDTIITLQHKAAGDEMRRSLLVMKSRGTQHSNKHHHFCLTGRGIQIDEGSI
jgi:circadian clock protein KaiC